MVLHVAGAGSVENVGVEERSMQQQQAICRNALQGDSR
jgi:hypothetical protein